MKSATLTFDGSCKGNPGIAAGGAVLTLGKEECVADHASGTVTCPSPIGTLTYMADGKSAVVNQPATILVHGEKFQGTSNEAEYNGLIAGVRKALELGVTHLVARGDSALVVNQVNGTWGIHKPHLRLLRERAKRLLDRIPNWTLSWIPREQNTDADRVANEALQR